MDSGRPTQPVLGVLLMATKKELQKRAQRDTRRIALPAQIGGFPIEQLQAAASSGPSDNSSWENRIVYMILNKDCSAGKVGEGKWDRPPTHLAAAMIRTFPASDWKGPGDWVLGKPLQDMLVANGYEASYIVLAKGLSKAQSKFGEGAVCRLMGLKRDGGWLLNVSRENGG